MASVVGEGVWCGKNDWVVEPQTLPTSEPFADLLAQRKDSSTDLTYYFCVARNSVDWFVHSNQSTK